MQIVNFQANASKVTIIFYINHANITSCGLTISNENHQL